MIRPIKYLGDRVLRKRAASIGRITPEIRKLIADMIETMESAGGIGLAAPQVGVLSRVFVTDVPIKDEPNKRVVIINPEIIAFFEETDFFEEGCLSIPKVTADVERPIGVAVRGLDAKGKKIKFEAEGLFARCIQHEIDHLDGVLFIDRAGISEKKALVLMKKLRDEAEAKEVAG